MSAGYIRDIAFCEGILHELAKTQFVLYSSKLIRYILIFPVHPQGKFLTEEAPALPYTGATVRLLFSLWGWAGLLMVFIYMCVYIFTHLTELLKFCSLNAK